SKMTEFQSTVDRMESKIVGLDTRLTAFQGNVEPKLQDFESSLDRVESRLDELQKSVNRIEHSQQDEVLGMLKLVKTKTETHESKIDVLNKRLLEAEAKLERVANL
ncbi:aminoacyltransferase, partial [Brevibacillus borstelensis]|uniref:aminoacyltransferase n=2 Tax=Brevibacillus borstelensis TaxID=45462 RepID=UPI001FAA9476